MKKDSALLLVVTGALLALVLSGCGPKGGVVILENQSSYNLKDCYISFGDSKVEALAPGQWMKASIDKNNRLVNTKFFIDDSHKNDIEIAMTGADGGGIWFLSQWTSPAVQVKDGETIVCTVRNK